MIITRYIGSEVFVRREPNEAPVRGGTWGTAESAFWGRLRDAANAVGVDPHLVRRCPAKDGHLTGAPYYLTTRSRGLAIWDGKYAIRSAAEDFNSGVVVELTRVQLK